MHQPFSPSTFAPAPAPLSRPEPRAVGPLTAAPPSFAGLALPHRDAAYKLAHWLVRDATAAEDVVQTAMTRALDHLGTFRGENARGWLLRIVRNTAYTWLAEQRRGPESLEDAVEQQYQETADPADDPEEALTRREERRHLAGMLAKLPPHLRQVLILREVEDMPYHEIADATGTPLGTVMSRLSRARRQLAKAVEQSGMRENVVARIKPSFLAGVAGVDAGGQTGRFSLVKPKIGA